MNHISYSKQLVSWLRRFSTQQPLIQGRALGPFEGGGRGLRPSRRSPLPLRFEGLAVHPYVQTGQWLCVDWGLTAVVYCYQMNRKTIGLQFFGLSYVCKIQRCSRAFVIYCCFNQIVNSAIHNCIIACQVLTQHHRMEAE